jgi:hypothetical protein
MRFEVVTVVVMIEIIWDATLGRVVDNCGCLGRASCLDLKCQTVQRRLLDPEDGVMCCYETSVTADHLTWCNIPEDLDL